MTHSEEPAGRESAGSAPFRPRRPRLARGHATRRYVRACQEAARAALRTTAPPTTTLRTAALRTTVTRRAVTRGATAEDTAVPGATAEDTAVPGATAGRAVIRRRSA